MKIRFSSVTKRPYIKINNTRHYGFRIDLLPKRFAEVKSREPITSWFNHKGFTFMSEQNWLDMFGNITIH